MKKIQLVNVLLIVSVSLFYTACSHDEKNKTVYIKASNIKKELIPVEGMTCLGCEVTLEQSIKKIEGVAKVKASKQNNSVAVEYDKTQTNTNEIIKSIEDAGYKADK